MDGDPRARSSRAAHFEIMPASWIVGAEASMDLVAVRLVYTPIDPAVKSVNVAGSFNDWNPQEVRLRSDGQSWSAVLILPRDTYDYSFIENGEIWVPDPSAPITRDDGFGGRNAVLDLRI
jgi:1,4-alpha-glucan branching enzyme